MRPKVGMKAKNAPGRFLGQSNRFVLFVRHGWPAKPLNICSAPPEIDTELRELLWQNKEAGGGFEDALATLEKDFADHPGPDTERRLNTMIVAIVGMLNDERFHGAPEIRGA